MDDRLSQACRLTRLRAGEPAERREDWLAREEPLQLRLNGRDYSVLMRTPGHDRQLALGHLLAEGVISGVNEVLDMVRCAEDEALRGNSLDVILAPGCEVDWPAQSRASASTSSCGVCGKTSIEAVLARRCLPPLGPALQVPAALLTALPEALRQAQPTFAQTGGLHACALFSGGGELLALREDVGRHNALDKLIGWALQEGRWPCSEAILLLSGRVSFEMMQKAAACGVGLVAAISAPSSLAVQFAEQSGQTLVAFLRAGSMNVYTHPQRVVEAGA